MRTMRCVGCSKNRNISLENKAHSTQHSTPGSDFLQIHPEREDVILVAQRRGGLIGKRRHFQRIPADGEAIFEEPFPPGEGSFHAEAVNEAVIEIVEATN